MFVHYSYYFKNVRPNFKHTKYRIYQLKYVAKDVCNGHKLTFSNNIICYEKLIFRDECTMSL